MTGLQQVIVFCVPLSHLAVSGALRIDVDRGQVVGPVLGGHDAWDVDQLLPLCVPEGVLGRSKARTFPATTRHVGSDAGLKRLRGGEVPATIVVVVGQYTHKANR